MIWFYQKKGWGLGNFIMATPCLELLSKKYNNKINVFFYNKNIEELFKSCNFINILDKKPSCKPIGTSSSFSKKRLKRESDIELNCRILVKKYNKIPSTYIDNIENNILNKKLDLTYVAIFHGCLGKVFQDRKDIGASTRQYLLSFLLKKNCIPVLLGSKGDSDKYWVKNNLSNSRILNYIGKLTLKESVGVLNSCDCFISNDTGLYHVAGALKKKGLVLWKKTSFHKNKSFFSDIEYCLNPERYKEDIEIFINNYIL